MNIPVGGVQGFETGKAGGGCAGGGEPEKGGISRAAAAFAWLAVKSESLSGRCALAFLSTSLPHKDVAKRDRWLRLAANLLFRLLRAGCNPHFSLVTAVFSFLPRGRACTSAVD